jgi:hypothetical protein
MKGMAIMKNNLFLRVIAMLIVVIMLGSMVVACNNGETPDNGKTPSDSTQGDGDKTDDGTQPGTDKPVTPPTPGEDEEEAIDMDGYTFTALARETEWFSN